MVKKPVKSFPTNDRTVREAMATLNRRWFGIRFSKHFMERFMERFGSPEILQMVGDRLHSDLCLLIFDMHSEHSVTNRIRISGSIFVGIAPAFDTDNNCPNVMVTTIYDSPYHQKSS